MLFNPVAGNGKGHNATCPFQRKLQNALTDFSPDAIFDVASNVATKGGGLS